MWRMLLRLFPLVLLGGYDSNNDTNCNNDSELLHVGYYVPGTILSALHVIHLIPITTLQDKCYFNDGDTEE